MKKENLTKVPLKQKQLKDSSRRSFLKKSAYAAPTIVALGALTKPTESEAGAGLPPSGPAWS